MKPHNTRFIIFVRPVGSMLWTQHVKNGIPYYAFNESEAFDEACHIAEHFRWCSKVAKVPLKDEVDTNLAATNSDGDITFYPTPQACLKD